LAMPAQIQGMAPVNKRDAMTKFIEIFQTLDNFH
jgi:hypothetical protein